MNEISPFGWILIAVIGMIVLSSYFSLFTLMRKRGKKPEQSAWSKSWRAISNPFEAEDQQLDELSKQVSELTQDTDSKSS